MAKGNDITGFPRAILGEEAAIPETPLVDLLTSGDETVPLDVAALEIAEIEDPDLDPMPFLRLLDSHAAELGELVDRTAGGPEYIAAANEYFFQQLGFRGAESNYYAAANSCLNRVLTDREGIPITLSLVYMEVARRLGRPVHGIGLPGHFLVQYDDGGFAVYIDVFHGGRILAAEECRELALQITGVDIAEKPALLEPATKWQIAVRMLHNLRAVYARHKEYSKLVRTLDLLLVALPDSKEDRDLRDQIRRYLQMMN